MRSSARWALAPRSWRPGQRITAAPCRQTSGGRRRCRLESLIHTINTQRRRSSSMQVMRTFTTLRPRTATRQHGSSSRKVAISSASRQNSSLPQRISSSGSIRRSPAAAARHGHRRRRAAWPDSSRESNKRRPPQTGEIAVLLSCCMPCGALVPQKTQGCWVGTGWLSECSGLLSQSSSYFVRVLLQGAGQLARRFAGAEGAGAGHQHSFTNIRSSPLQELTTRRVLDSSLVDLQALMAQAQAMVDLAEQFRLQLARAPPESAGQEVRARRVFWRQIPARAAVLGISLSAGSVFDINCDISRHPRLQPLQAPCLLRAVHTPHHQCLARVTNCSLKMLFLVLRQVMSTDLSEDLVSMGIAAPVTKETAGRKYHKELSRQVRSVFSRIFHAIGSEALPPQAEGCRAHLSSLACAPAAGCQEDRISGRESVILLRTQIKAKWEAQHMLQMAVCTCAAGRLPAGAAGARWRHDDAARHILLVQPRARHRACLTRRPASGAAIRYLSETQETCWYNCWLCALAAAWTCSMAERELLKPTWSPILLRDEPIELFLWKGAQRASLLRQLFTWSGLWRRAGGEAPGQGRRARGAA